MFLCKDVALLIKPGYNVELSKNPKPFTTHYNTMTFKRYQLATNFSGQAT